MTRKYFIVLLISATLLFAIEGVYWLVFMFFIILGFYLLFNSRNIVSRLFKKYKFLQYVIGIPTIFALAIALRVFVFEIYAIPSSSMESTILPGDKILVNKLLAGPVMPDSPFDIPWINIIYYLNEANRDKTDSSWWEYRRLNGFVKIRHQDIVVFKFLANNKQTFIKRCVALPGDTLLIDDSKVFINGLEQKYPESLQLRYCLFTHDIGKLSGLLDSLNLRYFRREGEMANDEYGLFMTKYQAREMENLPCVDSLKRYLEHYGMGYKPFVKGEGFEWSIDYFGPILIPKKGMIIKLDYNNFIKYGKCIRQGEGVKISFNNNEVQISGETKTSYVFKNDYYFMLGDNRYDSRDSRFVGMVPEELIIGKTKRILYSTYHGKFQWGRLFRRL